MISRYILICQIVLLSFAGLAQTDCNGGVFTTQTQVDDFLLQNPDCNSAYFLMIYLNELNSDPILNLDAFGNLTYVDSLVVSNNAGNPLSLIPLTGLGNIAGVADASFSNVYNFSGLEGLADVANNLRISNVYGNGEIFNLTPFNNLVSAGTIYMSMNAPNVNLQDVFQELTSLDSLIIGPNATNFSSLNLGGLTGFNQLSELKLLRAGQNSPGTINSIGNFSLLNNALHIDEISIGGLMCNNFMCFQNLQSVGDMFLQIRNNSGLPIELPLLETAENITITVSQQSTSAYDFPMLGVCNNISLNQSFGYGSFTVLFPVLQAINGNFQYIQTPNSTTNSPFILDVGSLESISGNFVLQGSFWNNLDAFEHLDYIGGNALLTGNYMLSNCDIYALSQLLSVNPASITVQNNANGCNSIADIAVDCQIGGISGVVYIDANCNGLADDEDVVVSNPVVLGSDGLPVGISSTNGTYFIPFAASTSFELTPQLIEGTIDASTINLTTGTTEATLLGNDLFLCPDPSLHDVSVSAYSFGPPRPGFTREYSIVINNLSYNTESGTVVFDISDMPGVTVQNAYTGTVDGSLISFSFENLPPLGQLVLDLALITDASTPIGTVQQPVVTVSITNDMNSENNSYSWTQVVVGSYDPNDITVDKPAINFETLEPDNTWLYYTIRFQNTGNFPADFVRVIDVIEEDLELSTIDILNTSHGYELSFNGDQVSWFFDNIMLPDSASDPLGSQGSIHYRIRIKSDVVMEDIIENTAAIYFDYNAPIITNTATTIFYICPEPISITGTLEICEGETTLLMATDGYEAYSWLIDGENIATEQSFGLENFIAGSYTLVYEGTTEFCSSTGEVEVTINAIPGAPTITQNANTLTASGNGVFVWTLNGEVLSDTDNSINMTESGEYSVYVITNDCVSNITGGSFISTGVESITNEFDVAFFPNPVRDVLNVTLIKSGNFNVSIFESSGRLVQEFGIVGNKAQIECNVLPDGIYWLVLSNEIGEINLSKSFVVVR